MVASCELDRWCMPPGWQTICRARCTTVLHLWELRLATTMRVNPDDWASLSLNERVRAEGFHRHMDRLRFVYGRVAVRHLLGRHMGLDPQAVPLTTNHHGKPILAWEGLRDVAPQFNVSHSGERVVLACSSRTSVGIDIEQTTPGGDPADLADLVRHNFTREEQHHCRQGNEAAAFFEIWTAKEAVLKCWGCGLAEPLKNLCIAPMGNEGFEVRWRGQVQAQTTVFRLDIGDGYAAAVATGSSPAGLI